MAGFEIELMGRACYRSYTESSSPTTAMSDRQSFALHFFVVAIRLRKAHAGKIIGQRTLTRRDDFTTSTPNRGNHMSNPDQGGQQNQGGQQDQKPGQQQQNPGQGGQQQGDQKPGQQEQQK